MAADAPGREGGRREANKAGNRAAILAAARRVFADLGYEAATVRDVIGATSLAAGTFYNYFRDKESVLRALVDAKVGDMQERSRAARREARSVEDVVRSALRVSFAMVAEDPDLFVLLQRNAGALRSILDEPSFVAGLDDLRADLEAAMRREGLRGVDGELLTAAISGLAFELAACAVARGPHAVDEAARFATALVLGGVRALAAPGARTSTALTTAARTRSVRTTAAAAKGRGSRRAE